MEVVVYPTTSGFPSKDLEKVINIKTVEDSRKDCPLTNPIRKTEGRGEHSIPSYISKLEHINEDQNSEEDFGELSLKKLKKENRMTN